MGNFQNIKPYADINHVMAKYGGVDAYLKIVEDVGRQKGILEERSVSGQKMMAAALAAVAVWETARWGYRAVKGLYDHHKESKIEELTAQAEVAKEAIRKEMASSEETSGEGVSVITRRRT